MATSTERAQLIARIESKRCPNSTDDGGKPSRHYVTNGACCICDRSVAGLARLHGLA